MTFSSHSFSLKFSYNLSLGTHVSFLSYWRCKVKPIFDSPQHFHPPFPQKTAHFWHKSNYCVRTQVNNTPFIATLWQLQIRCCQRMQPIWKTTEKPHFRLSDIKGWVIQDEQPQKKHARIATFIKGTITRFWGAPVANGNAMHRILHLQATK